MLDSVKRERMFDGEGSGVLSSTVNSTPAFRERRGDIYTCGPSSNSGILQPTNSPQIFHVVFKLNTPHVSYFLSVCKWRRRASGLDARLGDALLAFWSITDMIAWKGRLFGLRGFLSSEISSTRFSTEKDSCGIGVLTGCLRDLTRGNRGITLTAIG